MFGSVGDDKQLLLWDTRRPSTSGKPHSMYQAIPFYELKVGNGEQEAPLCGQTPIAATEQQQWRASQSLRLTITPYNRTYVGPFCSYVARGGGAWC
eukprot:3923224-Pyramimonas_sp.AAC.2